ncbi:MAG: hypothetical protein P8X90_31215, partial [Desulfobacterales bacterium]
RGVPWRPWMVLSCRQKYNQLKITIQFPAVPMYAVFVFSLKNSAVWPSGEGRTFWHKYCNDFASLRIAWRVCGGSVSLFEKRFNIN